MASPRVAVGQRPSRPCNDAIRLSGIVLWPMRSNETRRDLAPGTATRRPPAQAKTQGSRPLSRGASPTIAACWNGPGQPQPLLHSANALERHRSGPFAHQWADRGPCCGGSRKLHRNGKRGIDPHRTQRFGLLDRQRTCRAGSTAGRQLPRSPHRAVLAARRTLYAGRIEPRRHPGNDWRDDLPTWLDLDRPTSPGDHGSGEAGEHGGIRTRSGSVRV